MGAGGRGWQVIQGDPPARGRESVAQATPAAVEGVGSCAVHDQLPIPQRGCKKQRSTLDGLTSVSTSKIYHKREEASKVSRLATSRAKAKVSKII